MKQRMILLAIILILAACSSEEEPSPTQTPEPEATFPTPDLVESDQPAIELVAGASDSCVNEDTSQSTLLGFDVIYYQVATSNFMSGTLEALDGEYVYEIGTFGEGRDGEGGFGFYPTAYELPPNTPMTITIVTHHGEDAESPVSSTSTLTYDCTTGETIDLSFERTE